MDTQTAKPNAVSAELPTTVYCIHCEGMVDVVTGAYGTGHVIETEEGRDFCTFPDGYAFVAPPEMPPHIVDEMRDTGDWAAQDEVEDGDMCADEAGAWED